MDNMGNMPSMPNLPNLGNFDPAAQAYAAQAQALALAQKKKKKKRMIIAISVVVGLLFMATAGFLAVKFLPGIFNKGGGSYSSFVDPTKVMSTTEYGYVPVSQITVMLKDGVDRSKAQTIASDLKGKITGEIKSINLYLIDFSSNSEGELTAAIAKAQSYDGVDIVSTNSMVYGAIKGTQGGPFNDPLYKEGNNSKNYNNIGMSDAYKILKASGMNLNPVKVGVADEPLRDDFSEATGKTKFNGDKTKDLQKDMNGNIEDGGNNHGTLVTSVIAANGDNGGVTGVASIMGENLQINVSNIYTGKEYTTPAIPDPNDPTKVTFSDGTFYHNTLLKLEKLVADGNTVINCSFGPDHPSNSEKKASQIYKKFFEKMAKDHPEVVFVAAAGNEGNNSGTKGELDGENYYPGGLNLSNVVTVGATNADGNRANFSNFTRGKGEVTIAAPGVDIPMATDDNGKTIMASGTSFATPMVAGTIALMKSIDPNLTASQIKNLLKGAAAKSVKNGSSDQMIPIAIGGGILRVDDVVFTVINKVRAEKGLPLLDKDFLIKMSTIEFSAKGGPNDFTLTATIPAIGDKGTDLVLDITGQHSLTRGNTTEHITSIGIKTWAINAVDKSVMVKVTRNDTGAYAYLTLNTDIPLLSDLAGTWNGTFTIVDFDLPATITVPDDIFAGTTKEEGCADKVEKIKNVPQRMILNLTPTSDTACSITMTLPDTADANSGGSPSPVTYSYNQEEGLLTASQEGASISMYATQDDKTYILGDGSWIIDTSNQGKRFMIKASLEASKPK